MIGKIISHYKILEKLGEGGMGVVYKARDIKLERIVALKFLPPNLSNQEAEKKRFIHEAKAASALDHNNICTIYEIDETIDGQLFIAMSYLEGKILREKIDAAPIKVDEAIGIAIQTAEGLKLAHEKGIVHRDIKPANLMITTSGTVKIMDFGLAKLEGKTKLTQMGTTLGTFSYMSPEQSLGEEVDRRTDIWSLGVVLYEMMTGQLPFKGDYEQAVIYSIINGQPEPLTSLRSGIPMELERITNKLLTKNRDERYQSMTDVLVDLQTLKKKSLTGETTSISKDITKRKRKLPIKWIITCAVLAIVTLSFLFIFKWRSSTPPIRSIAVLPFIDMSPQKDQEYFCDGMTEELITRLGNIRELKVPARTSVFTFKGHAESISDIGQKLNVETVLEGSIRKANNKIRITAQLINIADGYHLWSETYDQDLKEVFAIQDEISSAIVEALKLKLTSIEKQKISERPMDNIAAYEFYLKATQDINRFTEDGLNRALQNLQKGIEISGDDPLLYSGMALVYWQYVNIGVKQEEYIMKAENCIKKTLQLDPHSPQAYVVLGTIEKDFRGNPQEAIRDYKKALAENPNEIDAMRKLSYLYILEGKSFAALPLLEKCKRIDPLNVVDNFYQGLYNLYSCKYDMALEPIHKKYLADTEDASAQFFYSLTLAYNNDLQKAFSIIEHSAKKSPDNVISKLGLMLKYGLMKNKNKVLQEMTPEFQNTCRRDPEWSYIVTLMLSISGIKKDALDWLDNAVSRGFFNYPLLQKDPFLDNIRSEDRFKKLLEQVKYEWEHLKV